MAQRRPETRGGGGYVHLRRGADGRRHLVGMAIPYGEWSEDLGGFRERIMPGAARETIARDDIRAQFNHDSNFILGRVSAGTLRLWEDQRGLHYDATLPDTQWARDLVVSIGRQDITGNSFAMWVGEGDEEWVKDASGLRRTIRRLTLREIGPQPYPAYPQSTVAVRSLDRPEVVREVRARGEGAVGKRRGRHPSVLLMETEMDEEELDVRSRRRRG